MINKINIEKYWDDYPTGANFIYKQKYGDGVIKGEVEEGVYQDSGKLTDIISTKGVKYRLSEITLESKPEMIRRIREEKLNKLL